MMQLKKYDGSVTTVTAKGPLFSKLFSSFSLLALSLIEFLRFSTENSIISFQPLLPFPGG